MPVYSLTFQQWFDSIVNTPLAAPQQAITVTYNAAKNKYVFLKYSVEAVSEKSKDSDIQIALAQGDTEEIRDLKGVETVVSLKDLAGSPLITMQKVLQQTRDDIFNLDELGAVRSAKMMGNMMRGKTEDEDGRDLSRPTSMVLQAMGLRYPSLMRAGIHQYQLLVNSTPSAPTASYMDRRSVEVGEEINPAFRTYERQATSMHGMAELDEVAAARLNFRNQNIQNFNLTSLRELELSLPHVLDHKLAGNKRVTGELTKYVKANGGLPSMADPNYDVEMAGILGISPTDFANPTRFSDATKKYMHSALHAEAINIRIETGDAFLSGKIDSAIGTQLGFTSGSYPSWMSTEMQSAWDDFVGSDGTGGFKAINLKNRMTAYDSLRSVYLREGRIADWRKVAVSDLGLDINGTRYGGIRFTNLYSEDMAFEYQKALVESYMIFENHAAEINRDIYNAAVERAGGNTNAGRMALDRYEAATNNLRLSNNMFFSSTTKEILENLRDGKFMNNAFVISRFFNTLPFVDNEFRNLRAYTKLIDPTTYLSVIEKTPAMKSLGKLIFDDEKTPLTKLTPNVASFAFIGFESDKLPTRGLGWVAKKVVGEETLSKVLENKHYIFHQGYNRVTDAAGVTTSVPSGVFKAINVKASQVKGLFGRNSAYELLTEIQSMRLMNGLMTGTVGDFISDPTRLDALRGAIRTVSSAGAGHIPANAFEQLAHHLGFAHGGGRLGDVTKYLDSFDEVLKLGGAMDWLKSLSASGKIPDEELWKFLQGMANSGKAANLAEASVIGPLNIFNRYANAARDFLYKNVIWGSFGNSIPGMVGIKGILRGLGMSEEIGLIMAAKNWGWIQRIVARGQALNAIGQGTYAAGAAGAVSSKLATFVAARAARSVAWKAVAKTLGYILGNAAGIVSGGIGFVLATAGSIAFRASMKILKGDFMGVYYVTKEEITGLVNVVKKLIIFPLFALIVAPCGCIILFIIMIVVVVIPGMMAPHEELTAGISAVVNSEILEVEKTAEMGFFSSDYLYFTITVKNKSAAPATIASFRDTLSFTMPCSAGGMSGGSAIYTEGSWDKGKYGALQLTGTPGEISMAQVESAFLGKVLQPGEEFTFEYELYNTSGSGDGTYYNAIELSAAEEPTKSATASANYAVGSGGCTQCPEGWPVAVARVTVIPNSSTVRTHMGVEAIDFGGVVGDTITATHSGTVSTGSGWSGGYGNHVNVLSDMGFRSTYAHMSVVSVSDGDVVTRGQKIGEMGYSGNVWPAGIGGTHLHYEFRKDAGGGYPECYPGKPVKMYPPYVPERPTSLGLY